LEREVGCPVEQQDDGSRDRMYDLKVIYEDSRTGAVEVTAAADAETIEFSNSMNTSGRWVVPDLAEDGPFTSNRRRESGSCARVSRPPNGLRKCWTPELRHQTPGVRR
jgi:hypothetical protein